MVKPIKLFTSTEYHKTVWGAHDSVGTIPIGRQNPLGYYAKSSDNGHYFICFNNNALTLRKADTATPEALGKTTCVWSVSLADTMFCCGVKQVGGFGDFGNPPDDIGDLFVKILVSMCAHSFSKGTVQAYFYRYNNSEAGFQHENILNAFVRNGFRANTDETHNPNSGNVIIGYEFNTNSKKPTPTKKVAAAVLASRAETLRARVAKSLKPTLAGN